jgi:DNA-binding IclR family transcriptional regulator
MDDARLKRAAKLRRDGLTVREVVRRMRLPKSTVDRAMRPA